MSAPEERPGRIRRFTGSSRVPTLVLLTCAAIGVAGGVLLWGAMAASTLLLAVFPLIPIALAGLWLLPATLAMRLLQRPGAAVLVGLVSGIIALPYIGASLWWAFFAELPFLLVIYRYWGTWLHYAGAVIVGVVYPILSAEFYNLWSMTVPAMIGFFALTMGSCLGGTALGILIADRLRRAGVARLARRRPA